MWLRAPLTPLPLSKINVISIADLQCKLPPETGPCRARILAYFFNSTSHRCETFIYGGCQGNANRFGTADECATSCCPEPDHCRPDCSVSIVVVTGLLPVLWLSSSLLSNS